MQFLFRPRPGRVYSLFLTIGACTGLATVMAATQLNAQSATIPAANAEALPVTGGLEAAMSPTTIPLTGAIVPTTPWPVVMDISQSVLATPHDLFAYGGVENAARHLLNGDYTMWRSHFEGKTETSVLPTGLLLANGCLKPDCNFHKSLLIVNPATQKVYAAMVTRGKVAMWPSLMTWPDAAVPSLKTWLADATDDD